MATRHFTVVPILANGLSNARIEEHGGQEGDAYRASQAYPQLREYVEDELAVFIIDTEKPTHFWEAEEFFHCVGVQTFTAEVRTL